MALRFSPVSLTVFLLATLNAPFAAVAQSNSYFSKSHQSALAAYPRFAEVPSTSVVVPPGDFEHDVLPTPVPPVAGTRCAPEQTWPRACCSPAPTRQCCGSRGAPGCCQPCNCGPWYASAAGLFLDRSEPTRVWTTYETGNNANQIMNTQNADTDWEGGAEFRLGRYFCCNRWALEFGYWSVGGFNGDASITHPSYVSSPLLFNDLEFGAGDPVQDYFDSAEEHRLHRSNELHNFEVNIIRGGPCSRCNRWSTQMLVGFRYFKFDEDLTFDTLDQGGTWGGNSGLDQVRLASSVSNDLFGTQVGCVLQRQLGCRTRAIITPKFGIYNNHVENYFDLRRGDGTAAMPSAFSGISGNYPVRSESDEIAFLSELNAGLQYQATCRCTLVGGYRVVVLTNMALADEQIPQYIVDIPEIEHIVTTGSLVLHGAYFGATWCF